MDAHTGSEWLAAISIGVSLTAATSIPYFLFIDATPGDFDPRPLAGRIRDRVLVELVNARYAARDAAITIAALLMLLTTPETTR